MFNSPWLFGLLAIPIFYLITFFIFSVLGDVSIFIKAYGGVGCIVAIGLFFLKKAKRERSVWPINGSINQNYDRFYKEFSNAGFKIEEYESLDGKQLHVFLDHPGKSYFVLMGFILLMVGILPGIIWFILGRDRLSITLKENAGFVQYIFETNNGKYAGKVWQRIGLQHTKDLMGTSPGDLETTVDIL